MNVDDNCVLVLFVFLFFFFKQKTAYEMRISDWSSDVCSSDLANVTLRDGSIYQTYMGYVPYVPDVQIAWAKLLNAFWGSFFFAGEIGRASCRERVCQYV